MKIIAIDTVTMKSPLRGRKGVTKIYGIIISEIVFETIKYLFFIFKIIIGTNKFSFNMPDMEEEMNGLERLLCESSTCV